MHPYRTLMGVAAIVLTSAASIFIYRATASAEGGPARDVAVMCGPDHRAVLRQGDDQSPVMLECQPTGASAMRELASWPAPDPFSDARMIPATYAPVHAAPAPVVRAQSERRAPAPVRRVEKKEATWKKRAVVIGGSAGAGAGIGALIGGKKGALIGAAIGGGGATVIDQIKHR